MIVTLNDLVLITIKHKEGGNASEGKLHGKYAVVVEIDDCDTNVSVEQLELTGHTTETDVVRVNCLEVVNNIAPPQWRAAYAVWKGLRQNQHMDKFEFPTEEQQSKIIELVANKYGIDCETVKSILNDLYDLGAL